MFYRNIMCSIAIGWQLLGHRTRSMAIEQVLWLYNAVITSHVRRDSQRGLRGEAPWKRRGCGWPQAPIVKQYPPPHHCKTTSPNALSPPLLCLIFWFMFCVDLSKLAPPSLPLAIRVKMKQQQQQWSLRLATHPFNTQVKHALPIRRSCADTCSHWTDYHYTLWFCSCIVYWIWWRNECLLNTQGVLHRSHSCPCWRWVIILIMESWLVRVLVSTTLTRNWPCHLYLGQADFR